MTRFVVGVAILASALSARAQTITSVVGHSNGDGYPAAVAKLTPQSLACDAGGNLYVADWSTHRLRWVSPTGTISTLAVSGSPSLSNGVAVGIAGVVYASDPFRHQVWRDVAGAATVLAGVASIDGSGGFAGDGGLATAARLSSPAGIAVDKFGNVYVADSGNGRVRRIDLVTGNISTVAGGNFACPGACDGGPATSARINQPTAVAVDPITGDLVIAERLGHRVRVLRCGGAPISSACAIWTLAGTGSLGSGGDGGPASSAQLSGPSGVAIAADGTTYVADTGNHVVRAVGTDGIIRRIAGTGQPGVGDDGPALASKLSSPRALALCGVRLWIADAGNSRVRSVDVSLAAATPTTAAPPATATAVNTVPPPATFTRTPTMTATTTLTPTRTHTATPTCGCCSQCG